MHSCIVAYKMDSTRKFSTEGQLLLAAHHSRSVHAPGRGGVLITTCIILLYCNKITGRCDIIRWMPLHTATSCASRPSTYRFPSVIQHAYFPSRPASVVSPWPRLLEPSSTTVGYEESKVLTQGHQPVLDFGMVPAIFPRRPDPFLES